MRPWRASAISSRSRLPSVEKPCSTQSSRTSRSTLALKVQDELAARPEEADIWRFQQVQRSREEAGQGLDDEQRQWILALASDFPRLWNDPGTPHHQRKRMARLLIEDLTLTKATRSLGVHLRGGLTRQLTRVPERHVSEVYRTSDEVVAEVDRLLDDRTDGECAHILNQRGYRSPYGRALNPMLVKVVRDNYALKSPYDPLRNQGLFTVHDAAARLGVTRRPSNRNSCNLAGLPVSSPMLVRLHVMSSNALAHCIPEFRF